jgi:hypothetical protein
MDEFPEKIGAQGLAPTPFGNQRKAAPTPADEVKRYAN